MLSFIVKVLLVIFIIFVLAGGFRTWQIQNDSRQSTFAMGTVPNPRPDGFYNGTVSGNTYSWLGKKFSVSQANGVNVFGNNSNSKKERYFFKTYVSKESYNSGHHVLKIDYNVPGNMPWIRLVVDEIVEVAPGEYLGKMELRFIPEFPFDLLYFELKK